MTRISPLTVVESVVVPSSEEQKAHIRDVWAFVTNRNVPRALRVVSQQYEGADIPVPAPATVRQWIVREDWHTWANAEWAKGYGPRVQRLKEGMFTVLELLHDRHLDALTGGAPLTKEEVALTQTYQKMFGYGALGYNQGGSFELSFNVEEAEEEALSLEQRARRLRALTMERNKGAG